MSDETYRTWFRGHPKPDDILFVCKGSPGRTNWVPDPVDFCIAQDMVAVRADPKKIYPKYLFAVLRSSVVQSQIDNMHVGTMIPHFKKGDFGKLRIPVLRSDAQRVIGDFYFTVSERITLLRETNATLEAIAQALFKSWFVDFDPVRAKAEGCQPEGMNAPTAALFPDSFEESELGLVPKGWEIGQLQGLLVLQRGFDLPAAERTEGQYPLIAASGPSGTHHIAMAKGPGVITGRSGVLGKVFLTLEDYWPLNTTLWVKEFKRATPCFAFQLLKLLDFGSFNAGSAVPTLNRNHIHSLKYVLPPVELVGAYEDAALVIHERVLENNRQAQTLTQLRDTVLPRLISGQLRLPEAMAQISESTAQELQYAN
ncbi:restriction endonuclease subunit S [Pseudomonas sp. KHPS1]|nr:restriction endonuclease subunit S [Pseudomonas sp. KHPS1]UTH37699.1 restriction endonuclease subunit S [Pseudomonas sp. KHPS1]